MAVTGTAALAPTAKEPSAAQRKMFAKMGVAMPDGSYYVRNASDLSNAIQAVGRGEAAGDSGDAIRKHIMTRAAVLKLTSKIPATWNSDGSLKHSDLDEFFEHFGVKGMRWGVRRDRSSGSSGGESSSHPSASADAERAQKSRTTAQTHGVSALSNDDLQHLVARMNLQQQYSKLSSEPAQKSKVKKGRDFVDDQVKSGRTVVSAIKTAQEVIKVVGPLIVVATAAAAGAKASGHTGNPSGPVRMPQLAIGN